MRIIVQPFGAFELCARLGLLFLPGVNFGGKVIHAVLRDSPCARAGLQPRDSIIAIDKTPWGSVWLLNFSERRPSELNLKVFVAQYFAVAHINVCVPPEPYLPIEDIVAEAANIVAIQPTPLKPHYVNPLSAEMRELLSTFRRQRRR